MNLLKGIGLFCLTLSGLVALFYNLDFSKEAFGSASVPLAKYLPYWLTIIGFFFLLLSVRVRFTGTLACIFLFFTVAIIGSLYSLLFTGVALEESYIGRALGGIVFVAFYWLAFDDRLLQLFMKIYLPSFLWASLFMALVMLLFSMGFISTTEVKIYHPDFALAISSIMLLPLLVNSKWMRRLIMLFILSAAMLTGSATDKVVVFFAILWLIFVEIKEKKYQWAKLSSRIRLGLSGVIVMAISSSLMVASEILNVLIESRLDERENEVRSVTFLSRWDEFLSHPAFGNLFTGSPLVDISYLHIPSHSDFLDLLALGGMLTIFLFYTPIMRLIISALKNLDEHALKPWIVFVILMFFIISSINPVLAQPRLGFHFFLAMGILAGWVARADSIVRKDGERGLL